jgi:hypothetical protein
MCNGRLRGCTTQVSIRSPTIFQVSSTTYTMMCPGRFPSPTPSREASPVPSTEGASPSPRAQHRVPSLDFTAPISFRKRPRFAETQSDSVVDHDRLSTSHLSATAHHTNSRRRVSDPLQDRTQSCASTNANTYPQQGRRAISTSSGSPPHSVPRVPAQPPVPPTCRVVDGNLRKKLREPLTDKDTRGIVYVFRDPSNTHRGYKIGWTTREDEQIRINEQGRACKFKPELVHAVYDVKNAFRAELLIHLDLKNHQIEWPCKEHNGGKTSMHQEWFRVTEEVAKETVDKWTRFMNEQKPYDWQGQLNPFWGYLLRARILVDHDNITHDMRREQWESILAPATYMDYLYFVADLFRRVWHACISLFLTIRPFCTAFFWQTLTVAYSFVTLIVFRNTFTSSAFALVSVCACVSAARHGLPKRVRSRGM